jgi:hypothetical protein
VNRGLDWERLELVQLDRWRSLGDPFALMPGALRYLDVELVPGKYALLRLDGGPGRPGLIRAIEIH